MQGITSLYRNGDADFTYDALNLTVSAQMALLALKVILWNHGFLKYLDFKVKNFEINLNNQEINMTVCITTICQDFKINF